MRQQVSSTKMFKKKSTKLLNSFLFSKIYLRNDVVPHLPPTSILGTILLYNFYVHPQREAWIRTGSVTPCDPNFYEDPNCSCSLNPSYTTADHSTYFNVVGDCSEIVTPAPPPSNPPPLPVKIFNFAAGAFNFLFG